jgi:hypothetical protein
MERPPKYILWSSISICFQKCHSKTRNVNVGMEFPEKNICSSDTEGMCVQSSGKNIFECRSWEDNIKVDPRELGHENGSGWN